MSTIGKRACVGASIAVVLGGGPLAGCTDELAATQTAPTSISRSHPVYPTATIEETPAVSPFGAAVRDGMFEFQVQKAMKDETLGDPRNPYMTATAQGLFVIFRLTVRNTGNEPRSYFGQNQKLIDRDGREYEASTMAELYINTDVQSNGINPGNAITVDMPFDVPPDMVMSVLELHDSAFSAGVRVAACPSSASSCTL